MKKEYKEDIRRIIRKEINDYCRKMIQHDIENIEVKEGFYEKEIRRSGLDGVSRVIDTKTIKDNFYLVTLKNGEQLSINEDHLESYDDFKDLDLTNKEGWRRFIRNRIDQGLKMFSVEEDKLKVFVYPSEEKFLESKNKMISDVIKEYKKEKQLGLNK